jgi:preprotein translocase subunit SecF
MLVRYGIIMVIYGSISISLIINMIVESLAALGAIIAIVIKVMATPPPVDLDTVT